MGLLARSRHSRADPPRLLLTSPCLLCPSQVHNDAMPAIKVDPETFEVTADGVKLTCEPAEILPLAQKYFLF